MTVHVNVLTWRSRLYANVIPDTPNNTMVIRAAMSVSHELLVRCKGEV